MMLDEDTLAEVARNGEMDYAKWPAIIEPLLQQLNYIVYHSFPLPRPYVSVTPNVSTSSESGHQQPAQPSTTLVSQTPTTPRTLPPVPPFPGSAASSTSQITNSQPEPSQPPQTSEADNAPPPELPLLVAQLLASITTTLRTSFSSKPPHTIQRLAELILHPNNHYQTLPSYLRALDRVVSVSSTADIFPLSEQPGLVNGVTNGEIGGILWKNEANGHDKTRDSELGSDESLGGALLTPIPWLRDVHTSERADSDSNEIGQDADGDLLEPLPNPAASSSTSSPDGANSRGNSVPSSSSHAATALTVPHHDPLVPERQDGAVTQGELIRMEQEAGVVPVTHSSQSNPIRTAGQNEPIPNSIALGVGIGLDDLEDEDSPTEGAPHARGPDVVGTVDMGLVGGRDVQVRIASPPDEGLRERGKAVNVNDAQSVLEGSDSNNELNRRKESGSDDSYVDVAQEFEEDDKMQVDSIESSSSKEKKDSDDDDIVLVDADGATENEREVTDRIGGQEGNDAGDTTR